MTIKMEWYIPQRVLHGRYPSEVDLADLEAARDKFLGFLDAGSPPIHYIVDLSKLEKMPLSLSGLRQSLSYIQTPNLHWVLTYGQRENRIIDFLASVITQFTATRYRSFATFDEAISFLYSVDETLPSR